MEKETIAVSERAEALKRAAAASTEVVASREQAQWGATELARREEATGQVLRQQRELRAKTLVRRYRVVNFF